MGKYDKMTQAEFARILEEKYYQLHPGEVLSIPGVWELVSEYLNNEILEAWEAEQEIEEEEEEEDD